MDDRPCPFCNYAGPSTVIAQAPGLWYMIEPVRPVVPGHVLVIPEAHVSDFAELPNVTAVVMRQAARWAAYHGGAWNLITSRGAAATQTVPHLHVHLVPRVEGDGLRLPWTP